MRILLTNDDGVFAPGIQKLSERLSEISEVFIAAPSMEQSGSSQAITVHQPIRVDEYQMDNTAIKAWSIGGTPADCVKIGLAKLIEDRPDFVISGINRGANLGTDVLYSGTVSAAREGAMNGIPSFAVSLDASKNSDFSQAALLMRQLLPVFSEMILPDNFLLNVNVPKQWIFGKDDVAFSKLGTRKYDNAFEKRFDPSGRAYYWMGGTLSKLKNSADTDVAMLENGVVSLTPLHFDLTDQRLFNELQNQKINHILSR